MRGLPFNFRRRTVICRLKAVIYAFFFHLILFAIVPADNRVFVDIVRQGQTQPISTLYIGLKYEFRVWIENDSPLSSLRITLRNWIAAAKGAEAISELGTYFTWLNVGGYGPSGIGTGHACVTVAPGSRMYPPESIWGFSKTLRVWEYNTNEISPPIVRFGAA